MTDKAYCTALEGRGLVALAWAEGRLEMPFDALPGNVVGDVVRLKIARDGVAKGWRQMELGLRGAEGHCLLGWLLEASDWDAVEATRLALEYVWPALPERRKRECYGKMRAIYTFNDEAPGSGEVVRVLDRAIESATG